MNLVLVLLILILLVGGYGWQSQGYYGGPYLGGGVGLVLLAVIVWLLIRDRV